MHCYCLCIYLIQSEYTSFNKNIPPSKGISLLQREYTSYKGNILLTKGIYFLQREYISYKGNMLPTKGIYFLQREYTSYKGNILLTKEYTSYKGNILPTKGIYLDQNFIQMLTYLFRWSILCYIYVFLWAIIRCNFVLFRHGKQAYIFSPDLQTSRAYTLLSSQLFFSSKLYSKLHFIAAIS